MNVPKEKNINMMMDIFSPQSACCSLSNHYAFSILKFDLHGPWWVKWQIKKIAAEGVLFHHINAKEWLSGVHGMSFNGLNCYKILYTHKILLKRKQEINMISINQKQQNNIVNKSNA